mmetsp:Transcript_22733/g.77349  ORF Transcript_22733/g.77349 Transcript_22733/m.77349 type:complete len:228 (+) Transcript_22733:685-1368(+)
MQVPVLVSHTRTDASQLPVKSIHGTSVCHATPRTFAVWPLSATLLPAATSHTRVEKSSDVEASRSGCSGDHARPNTLAVCPASSVLVGCALLMSHSVTFLPMVAVASRSGRIVDHATPKTPVPCGSLCCRAPSGMEYTHTDSSDDALASLDPSWLNETRNTGALWSARACRTRPLSRSYRNTFPSLELDATCDPSGLHATLYSEPVAPVSVTAHSLVVMFHSLTVLS